MDLVVALLEILDLRLGFELAQLLPDYIDLEYTVEGIGVMVGERCLRWWADPFGAPTSREWLCHWAPQALVEEQRSHVQVSAATRKGKERPIRKKKGVKTKEWIINKKETQRKKGKAVRPDTKYTARRRPTKF